MAQPIYKEKIGDTSLGAVFVEGTSAPNGIIDKDEKLVLETGEIVETADNLPLFRPGSTESIYTGAKIKTALKELGLEDIRYCIGSSIHSIQAYINFFRQLQNATDIDSAFKIYDQALIFNVAGGMVRDEWKKNIDRQMNVAAELVKNGEVWKASALLEKVRTYCKSTLLKFDEKEASRILASGFSICRQKTIEEARKAAEQGLSSASTMLATARSCAQKEGTNIDKEIEEIEKKAFTKDYANTMEEARRLSNDGKILETKDCLARALFFSEKAGIDYENVKAEEILKNAYEKQIIIQLKLAALLAGDEGCGAQLAILRAKELAREGGLNFQIILDQFNKTELK